VLINLVGNAVKFTSEGSVRIQADFDASIEQGGERLLRVRFSVTDTGIGIPPEKIERLFKPFSQADSSTTRRFGGAGLGLAICKRLSNLMGGDIDVESEAGRGSRFFFTIVAKAAEDSAPLADPSMDAPRHAPVTTETPSAGTAAGVASVGSTAPAAAETRAPRLGDTHPLAVLVAEDNYVNQRVIKLLLAKIGYMPEFASNGREAVGTWENGAFDLILMDVQMPELDGYNATREIRQREAARAGHGRVHICALTADAMDGDRARCISAGMDDYLSKPINPQRIAELLQKVWQQKTDAAPPATPAIIGERSGAWSPAATSIARHEQERTPLQ
jgi:CheY-like chemotaxis protein